MHSVQAWTLLSFFWTSYFSHFFDNFVPNKYRINKKTNSTILHTFLILQADIWFKIITFSGIKKSLEHLQNPYITNKMQCLNTASTPFYNQTTFGQPYTVSPIFQENLELYCRHSRSVLKYLVSPIFITCFSSSKDKQWYPKA